MSPYISMRISNNDSSLTLTSILNIMEGFMELRISKNLFGSSQSSKSTTSFLKWAAPVYSKGGAFLTSLCYVIFYVIFYVLKRLYSGLITTKYDLVKSHKSILFYNNSAMLHYLREAMWLNAKLWFRRAFACGF